jgi:hypothetical protein
MEINGQLHPPAALIPGNTPRYLLDRNWVCPRASLDAMEKINLFLLPGNGPQFLGRPAPSLVTIPTELFRFPLPRLLAYRLSFFKWILVLLVSPWLNYCFVERTVPASRGIPPLKTLTSENPVIQEADTSGSRTLNRTTNYKWMKLFDIDGRSL